MTFSLVKLGTRAVRKAAFPTLDGTPVETCGVRVMHDTLFDAIETAARKAAIERGVAEPRDGIPLYERWVRIFTVLYGCVDLAFCKPGPEPDLFIDDGGAVLFFDGGVEQIQQHLDPERIALLAALQEQWQAMVSPRPRNMNADDFIGHVYATSIATLGESRLPFWRWHPALQESFLISISRLLMSSPMLKSPPGSDSETSTRNDSTSGEAGVNQALHARVTEVLAETFGEARTYATEIAAPAPPNRRARRAVVKKRGRSR